MPQRSSETRHISGTVGRAAVELKGHFRTAAAALAICPSCAGSMPGATRAPRRGPGSSQAASMLPSLLQRQFFKEQQAVPNRWDGSIVEEPQG